MIRRPPRSTLSSSSAASDVYKRQLQDHPAEIDQAATHWKLEYKFLRLRQIYLSKYQHHLIYGWPLKAPVRESLSMAGVSFFTEDNELMPETVVKPCVAAPERRFAGSQGNSMHRSLMSRWVESVPA
eukprot:TRINITY_DN8096_c0_g1_i5.p1 TRINITY_DN8096_c0_g1~~TRINITY_DN8096_c0_g1_i5.p1  ORF type:complete len:127 (+),score=17.75 TRINITY_DN8096_c0_g1_i5:84-464(+)